MVTAYLVDADSCEALSVHVHHEVSSLNQAFTSGSYFFWFCFWGFFGKGSLAEHKTE